jgi:hypothetical protein
LLATHYVIVNGLPVMPAQLSLYAGTATLMAVPMIGVLAAIRFTRRLVLGVVLPCAFAAISVAISMLQRPFSGKAPTLDQLLNFFNFVGFAAVTLWLPLVLAAAIGARRVRGVAPFVFAGLLVFAVAPLLGVHLTQALGAMLSGASVLLRAGSRSARSSSRCRSACSPGGG